MSPGRIGVTLQENRGRPVGEPWWGHYILVLILVYVLNNVSIFILKVCIFVGICLLECKNYLGGKGYVLLMSLLLTDPV